MTPRLAPEILAEIEARIAARRRREPWLVAAAILIAVVAVLAGGWKFLATGDARWLLLWLAVLIFPRQ